MHCARRLQPCPLGRTHKSNKQINNDDSDAAQSARGAPRKRSRGTARPSKVERNPSENGRICRMGNKITRKEKTGHEKGGRMKKMVINEWMCLDSLMEPKGTLGAKKL